MAINSTHINKSEVDGKRQFTFRKFSVPKDACLVINITKMVIVILMIKSQDGYDGYKTIFKSRTANNWIHKNTTYDVGNPGPGLGHALRCGGGKPVNGS